MRRLELGANELHDGVRLRRDHAKPQSGAIIGL